MTLYTAKELAEITGLQAKHVWSNVKKLGITPQKVHGVQVLDEAQLKTYQERRASGVPWKAPEKARNERSKGRPRRTSTPPPDLKRRKSKSGKRYLEAPGPNEMRPRWVWTGDIGD